MGLEIKNFEKSYSNKKVVSNVSFKIDHPSALGLVGLNGAGKTTTIRMIIDIIKKDSGIVLWNDKELDLDKVKVGYLPEERGIYPKTKVRDQLIYFARLKGMTRREAEESLDKWSKKMGCTECLDVVSERLSKGNQQKIQLLTVFMHDPDLIILDEPLSGLDPVNAELVKSILDEEIKKGKYIIVTSHQMNVIEEFCDSLVMLKNGKIIMAGKLSDIKKEYTKNILCINYDESILEYLKNNFKDYEVSKNKDTNEIEMIISDRKEKDTVLSALLSSHMDISKFEIKTPSLREIFIEKAGEDNE